MRDVLRSHLPKPMPCEFVMPTPTPERTPTPTPDCPKIKWDIVGDDGNTISKESSTISLNVSKLLSGTTKIYKYFNWDGRSIK